MIPPPEVVRLMHPEIEINEWINSEFKARLIAETNAAFLLGWTPAGEIVDAPALGIFSQRRNAAEVDR